MTTETTTPTTTTNDLDRAATCYLSRRDRLSHPDGAFDGPRWRASGKEYRACCDQIRAPSRAYPWSEMQHCRTAVHVAHLFGVALPDLRRRARELDQRPTRGG